MEAGKKRLLWGAGLAWAPVLLVMAPMIVSTIRIMSTEKATGLAAVAGGVVEWLVTFGLIAFVVCEVGGIVLLTWEIRRGGWGRAAFCLVSIGCSLVVLTAVMLSVWSMWHWRG